MTIQVIKYTRKKSKGFTLLEILVAILILTLGAVTALGLNMAAIKSSNDARHQLVAISLASDLATLMNANPAQAGNASSAYYISRSDTVSTAPGQGTGLTAKNTDTEIAQRDIDLWYYRVQEELPGARVVVCFDSTPFNGSGDPQWSCSGSGMSYIKMGWRTGDRDEAPATPNIVIPVGVCDPFSTSSTISCNQKI